jgi:hypothetical protein
MKTLLQKSMSFALAMLISTGLLAAQFTLIPNQDFTNWENKNFGDHPADWIMNSLNENSQQVAKITTDAYEGQKAVYLSTFFIEDENNGSSDQQGYVGYIMPNFNPHPWTTPIDMLHVYAKYNIKANGAAGIAIALYDEDGEAYGMTIHNVTGNSNDEWQHIQIPLTLKPEDPTTPTSIAIYMSADVCNLTEGDCSYSRTDGSWIIVDNILLTYQDDNATNPILPPNNSFETWSSRFVYEPTMWTSDNVDFNAPEDYPLTQFTDGAYSGAKIEVKETSWGSKRGSMWLSSDLISEGVAYTDKPKALAITYKYIPQGNDEARIHINLIDNDGNSSGGSFDLQATYDEFKRTTVTWYMDNSFSPEHVNIELTAGDNVGSILYIDKIEFIELTEITFDVRSTSSNQPISGALLSIDGLSSKYFTDHTGRTVLEFDLGSYQYNIAAYNYNTKTSTLEVGANNQTITVYLDDFTPDTSKPIIQITDNDADMVYFEGSNFAATIQLPSAGAFLNNKKIKLVAVLFSGNEGTSELYPVFGNNWELETTVTNMTFTINENIALVTTPGIIGLYATHVEVEIAPGVNTWQAIPGSVPFPMIDTYKFNKDISYRGMAFVGISIPTNNVTASPALSAFENLYHTENAITFTKANHGSILFAPGLNIMDNHKKLSAFDTDFIIMSNPETMEFYAEINPNTLEFLSYTNTSIVTLQNIPAWVTNLDVVVCYTQFGVEVNDYNYSPAWNTYNWELNETERTVSFYVNHFSRYTLVLPENPETNIESAKATSTIQLFPTIAEDFVYITSDNEIQGVVVYDLFGKVVLQAIGESTVNVAHVASGMYIVHIQDVHGQTERVKIYKK